MTATSSGKSSDPRKLAHISVFQLVVDNDKQRMVNDTRVNFLATHWDWLLCEAATVVPLHTPDGENQLYGVIEGQTRVKALYLLSDGLEVPLEMPCIIVPANMVDAERFAPQVAIGISTGRVAHTPYEKWLLRYRSGGAIEADTKSMLETLGLMFDPTPGVTRISTVSACVKIIEAPKDHTLGLAMLRRVLTILDGAWTDPDSMVDRWKTPMINSCAEILVKNDGLVAVDDSHLMHSYGAHPAQYWLKAAKADIVKANTGTAVARRVAREYNHDRDDAEQLRWPSA